MERATGTRAAPLSVLLVEDSAADSRLLQENLREATESGEIALVAVRSLADALRELHRMQFSCVLLDLGLPDGQGVSNVEAVRAVDRHVAVVVLTGLDSDVSAQAALQLGAQDYVIKGQHDAAQLLQRVRHAVHRNRQVAELEDQHRKRFHNASRDPLTGLANRLLFDDRARITLAQATRGDLRFAVCFIDLDRFKAVNDTYGHSIGDELLKRVGEVLSDALRESDTAARIGGDEFAVLLAPTDHVFDPAIAGHRIHQRLAAIREVSESPVTIGASIGIARYPEDAESVDALMQCADMAMYAAKRSGGGVRVHGVDAEPAPRPAAALPASGSGTVEPLVLSYQPWFDADQQIFAGVDVIAQRTSGGIVESVALSSEEAEQMIAGACAQWARWRSAGFDPVELGLRLSNAQLDESETVDRLRQQVDGAGVPPGAMQFAIRSDALEPSGSLERLHAVQRLRDAGFRVVLDGFSPDTGLLRQLTTSSVDGVRLHPEVLRRATEEGAFGSARRFLVATNAACRGLGLSLIVDGVDSEPARYLVDGIGCRFLLGTQVQAPLPAETLAAQWTRVAQEARA